MRLLENLATTACNFQQRPCRGGAAPGRSGGSGRGAREPCLAAADMIPTERVRARRPEDPEGGQSNRYRNRHRQTDGIRGLEQPWRAAVRAEPASSARVATHPTGIC
jgi:hypothetical protein